ncbi:MAG: alpha/beta hydrolase [Sphingomonadaceae bacterium]|nr:alpha/beta hydrolase [Sphingomonadaceae bacterium]
MTYVETHDGTRIFYKDWGSGPIIAFSHGWPLGADAWEGQMLFFAQHGFRVIAHDRRGHQRSDQAARGNDVDCWADDLEAVFADADVSDATLVAHSTGGGEIARYVGRHGTGRVARMVLASAIVPQLAAGPKNPTAPPPRRSMLWEPA